MLIQGNCVKRITAKLGGNLQADSGESFLVRRLYCKPSASDTYLVLRLDRKTVGVYRVKGHYGNHLSHIREDYIPMNLMAFLESKGINITIPVAEGQTFNVSRADEDGEVLVVYDIYTAGDITANMPNGSDSKEFTFIQYMDAGDYPSVSGNALLNVSLSPAEFPDFPCGAVVPTRYKIDILGLCGTPVASKLYQGDYIGSTFVKLIKDRETLFDEDRNGIVFRSGSPSLSGAASYKCEMSLIGNGCEWGSGTSNDIHGEPLIFEPKLSFLSGEELLVYMSFFSDGTRLLEEGSIDLAAILHCLVE